MGNQISVIVPVYNVSLWLMRCVDSLLKQTVKADEIILVDDGSTDDSSMICDRLASENECVIVIHKENAGLSSARQAGFAKATGEYVVFVDSDDYVDPRYLESLSGAIIRHCADLAICGYVRTTDRSEHRVHPPFPEGVLDEELVERYVIPMIGPSHRDGVNVPGFMWIRMFRRQLVRESFFVSERDVFAEDIAFNLLYADGVSRIAIVAEPLYYYWQTPTSLSNSYRANKWRMLRDLWRFRKDYLEVRGMQAIGAERLDLALFSSVYATADNLALRRGAIRYSRALVDVREDPEVISMLERVPLVSLTRSQRVFFELFCRRLFVAIYFARRLRKQVP